MLTRYNDWAVIWQGKRWLALRRESGYAIVDRNLGVIVPVISQREAVQRATDNDKYEPIRG